MSRKILHQSGEKQKLFDVVPLFTKYFRDLNIALKVGNIWKTNLFPVLPIKAGFGLWLPWRPLNPYILASHSILPPLVHYHHHLHAESTSLIMLDCYSMISWGTQSSIFWEWSHLYFSCPGKGYAHPIWNWIIGSLHWHFLQIMHFLTFMYSLQFIPKWPWVLSHEFLRLLFLRTLLQN